MKHREPQNGTTSKIAATSLRLTSSRMSPIHYGTWTGIKSFGQATLQMPSTCFGIGGHQIREIASLPSWGLALPSLPTTPLSVEEVFIGSVRRQIIESGHLPFLKRAPERNRQLDLPSWVPEWCAEVDEDFDNTKSWLHLWSF